MTKNTKKTHRDVKAPDPAYPTPWYANVSEVGQRILDLEKQVADLHARIDNLANYLGNRFERASPLIDPQLGLVSGRWHKRAGNIYADSQAGDLRTAKRSSD